VVASRERLVRAGFEEQRRLERDLHDGAQQRLVALGMRLRVLQRSGAVPAAASSDLDAAVAELGTAVAELRRLAQGVRPSALEDGLAAALTEIAARTPGLVDLDVRASEVPDAVAVTAYFVVSEAVANALKHAGAERIRIVVESAADRLRLTIADDGRGGARARGGLTHMADRVDALGGTLSISSPPGDGTRIEAVLPCGS
jgi:signal transduction histidine kinase